MFMICLLLLTSQLSAVDYYGQGMHFAKEQQKQEIEDTWKLEKDLLKKKMTEIKTDNQSSYDKGVSFAEEAQKDKRCTLANGLIVEPQTSLYVFVSFSLADETWLTLSQELEKMEGVFILRGLPDNSFSQLAFKINSLRQKGVKATIQVNPLLYTKYAVQNVPSFVITEDESFDKLSGNVSLAFALEKMASLGDTALAKTLRKKL